MQDFVHQPYQGQLETPVSGPSRLSVGFVKDTFQYLLGFLHGSFVGFLQESFKEGCLSGSVQGFLVPSWVTT